MRVAVSKTVRIRIITEVHSCSQQSTYAVSRSFWELNSLLRKIRSMSGFWQQVNSAAEAASTFAGCHDPIRFRGC
jgi:hypothetical protein